MSERLNRYKFRSVWSLDRSCKEVFEALQQLPLYPSWWPEIKDVAAIGDATARVEIRAALPYRLRFELRQELADPEKGILEASMTGDLEGWSRWTLSAYRDGCRLLFEEDVLVNRPALKILSPVARPVLKANHSFMMRRGERGLRGFLSSGRPYPGT